MFSAGGYGGSLKESSLRIPGAGSEGKCWFTYEIPAEEAALLRQQSCKRSFFKC